MVLSQASTSDCIPSREILSSVHWKRRICLSSNLGNIMSVIFIPELHSNPRERIELIISFQVCHFLDHYLYGHCISEQLPSFINNISSNVFLWDIRSVTSEHTTSIQYAQRIKVKPLNLRACLKTMRGVSLLTTFKPELQIKFTC